MRYLYGVWKFLGHDIIANISNDSALIVNINVKFVIENIGVNPIKSLFPPYRMTEMTVDFSVFRTSMIYDY